MTNSPENSDKTIVAVIQHVNYHPRQGENAITGEELVIDSPQTMTFFDGQSLQINPGVQTEVIAIKKRGDNPLKSYPNFDTVNYQYEFRNPHEPKITLVTIFFNANLNRYNFISQTTLPFRQTPDI